jgi:hypothetical protein
MGSEIKIQGAAWDGPPYMTFRDWADREGFVLDDNDEYAFYGSAAAFLFKSLAEARGFTGLFERANTTGQSCVADWDYSDEEEEDDE